jgi:uncharacterized membrane protein YdbT with pleckstrin-like domain
MTISEELHEGEKLLKTLKPSRWGYFWWYLLGAIMMILVIPVGIIVIILIELIRRGHTFYITDKRVIHEFTFLSRKISSSMYDKIQDIHMSQGIIERMVGIGTIHIDTAGTTVIEIRFRGISNPVSVKRMIEEKMTEK